MLLGCGGGEPHQQKQEPDGERATGDQETITQGPERVRLEVTEGLEVDDRGERDQDEDIEREEDGGAGEIEQEPEGESDEESDSGFAKAVSGLAESGHDLRLSREGRGRPLAFAFQCCAAE